MNEFAFDELARQFDHCVGMAPEARESYFERLEAENSALARELRALIEAHQNDEGPLDESALMLLRRDAPALPEYIGKYRILGEIGRGGMGVVYLGIYEGDGFVQEVAIKLIKRGLDTDEIIRRFKRERRILSRLAHEQIARLVDGGATAEGLPYLVMERLHGERIDHWCSSSGLSVEERVDLFLKVCEAVSYAHRQLVIHRDLKPSNVLVTAEGVPKLLDFGVAGLLDNWGSELTTTEFVPHTPGYASPEQVSGGSASTLMDVYSLGMILYELLTGTRPQTEGIPHPSSEMRRQGVRLPSRLSQSDLHSVVLKSIQAEPTERYQSVDLFSEDLQRWLRGEPIQARPATLPYRLRRFVMRYRIGVAAAAALALALSIITGWALYQTRIANQARMNADRRFRETRELANTMLFGIYDQIEGLQGALPVRERIVREAIHYLDSLSADAGNDLQLRYELASGYRRLAGLQGDPMLANQGNVGAAMTSLTKAVRLQESVVSASPRSATARLYLAALYDDRARLLQAAAKPAEGRAEIARSIAVIDRVAAEQPTQQNRYRLALSLLHASAFNLSPDVSTTGIAQLERSVTLFDRLAAEGYRTEEFRIQHAFSHNRMGAVYLGIRKDNVAAERHYKEALEIEQALVKERPERADLRYNQTFTEHDLAEIYAREGRLDEALASYQRTLAVREEIASADPTDTRAQHGIASACLGLEQTLRALKRFPEALRYAERGVTIEERLAGPKRTISESLARAWWSVANAHLGWAKAQARRAPIHLELASNYYQRALDVYTKLRKDNLPTAT